jgi:hypothetical protein
MLFCPKKIGVRLDSISTQIQPQAQKESKDNQKKEPGVSD